MGRCLKEGECKRMSTWMKHLVGIIKLQLWRESRTEKHRDKKSGGRGRLTARYFEWENQGVHSSPGQFRERVG